MSKPGTLHPSILPRLDPEYAAFHNENIINLPQVHELPWDPSIRNTPTVPGSSAPLPVGRVKDYHLSVCGVRVFTPEGSRPERGWPVFIFFHGGTNAIPHITWTRGLFSCRQPLGGWTLGNINTENAFCTNMCKGKGCCHHFRCIEMAFASRLGRCQMYCRISKLQARARKPISRGRGRRRRGTAMGVGTRATHARDRHQTHRCRWRFQAGCFPVKEILKDD